MILDEYEAAALDDVREEYIVKLLREELVGVRKVQEEVAQAMNISIAHEQEKTGFMDKMFGFGEGGHEKAQARREQVEEVYKLRAEKEALDAKVQRLEDKVKEADTRRKNAHQKLWNAMPRNIATQNIATQNDAGVQAKEALHNLAMRVDPLNTECVNAIGKFIQRTPWFHIVHNFVPLPAETLKMEINGKKVREEEVEKELVDMTPHNACNGRQLWEKFQYLDALVEAATLQNAHAGRQLLSVLHDDTIDVSLQQHLARMATGKAKHIAAADEVKMQITGRRCAMTANWPTPDGGQQDLGAYDWISKETQKAAEDVRVVSLVAFRIEHERGGVLAEVGKWFACGHLEAEFRLPGKKVRLDERKETTVKRVLAGHLHLLNEGIKINPNEYSEYDLTEKESATTCMRTRYHRYIYKGYFLTESSALGPEYLNPIRSSDAEMLSEEFGLWALKAFVLPSYLETDSAIICAFVPESLMEQWLDPRNKSETKATLQRWLECLRIEPPQAPRRQGYEISKLPAKPETKIERVRRTIDEKFTAAVKRDSLLHISFECCLVLRKIASRGVQELTEHEVVLYGHKDIDTPPLHWFMRRKSAGKICEMALRGNTMACELIIERLLHDEHWPIRQLAATEICNILSTVQEDNPYIIPFVGQLAQLLFLPPRWKADQREFNNVLAATEKALIKEMPSYAPGVRDKVLAQLVRDCENFERHVACRPVLDRILQGAGYKISSSAHKSGAPTKRRGNV